MHERATYGCPLNAKVLLMAFQSQLAKEANYAFSTTIASNG
jgi:hypothetical protein